MMPFVAYGQEQCGMENCHGLDMSCALIKGPQACTAIYKTGDFCRVYAKCEMVEGQCRLIKEDKFDICVACLENCAKDSLTKYPPECEEKCRVQMEGNAAVETKVNADATPEPAAMNLEAPFATREDLAQAVKIVLQDKDSSEISGLYCWWGVDAEMKKQTLSVLENLFNIKISSVELASLPEDFKSEYVVNHLRYRPSVTPEGLVSIRYFDQVTGRESSTTIPYGEIDGGYCLVSTVREVISEGK